jgi:hypothetical protein
VLSLALTTADRSPRQAQQQAALRVYAGSRLDDADSARRSTDTRQDSTAQRSRSERPQYPDTVIGYRKSGLGLRLLAAGDTLGSRLDIRV